MPIHIKAGGAWSEAKTVSVKVGGSWVEADTLYVKQAGVWTTAWQNVIVYTNNSNLTAANIYTLMGSPKSPGKFLFINNAIISGGTSSYALRTGAFPAGSILTIVNNGTIRGKGGAGGSIALPVGDSGWESVHGEAGGHALYLDVDCEVQNANGYIYGGGGGGGGVAINGSSLNELHYVRAGGGGGAGVNGGAAGTGTDGTYHSLTIRIERSPAAGSSTSGGLGGIAHGVKADGSLGLQVVAGNGGARGAEGATGTWSRASEYSKVPTIAGYAGAAGNAIALNGHTVFISSGNTSSRIVGAVA